MPTDTIGSGGTYPDIPAWASATRDLDLVGIQERATGVLLDDVYELSGGDASLLLLDQGIGTRNSQYYRELVPNTPTIERYRGWSHTGPRIYVQWANQAGDQYGLDVDDPFFRMDGVAVISDSENFVPQNPADTKALVRVRSTNNVFLSCAAYFEDWFYRDPDATVGPALYCFWINGDGVGQEARDVLFYNCTAKGSPWEKGASVGWFFDVFSQRVTDGSHGCWNCTGYDFTKGVTTHAFWSLAATPSLGPEIVSCFGAGARAPSAGPADFAGLFSRYAANVSSDGSALSNFGGVNGAGEPGPDFPGVGNPGSQTFLHPNALVVSPECRDLRLRTASSLKNRGFDDRVRLSNTLSTSEFLQDADGNDRGSVWSVGPYEITAELPTAAPTVVEEDIGTAVGRAFASPEAWAAANEDLHLLNRNEVRIGVMHNDDDLGFTVASTLRIRRTVADSRRNLILRAADDQASEFNRFNIQFRRGVVLGGEGPGTGAVVDVMMPHVRMDGFHVLNAYGGSSSRNCITLRSYAARLDAIYCDMVAGTGSTNIGIDCRSDLALVTNVAVKGADSAGIGLTRGVQLRDCVRTRFLHCLVDRVQGNNATTYGFHEGLRSELNSFENSIGMLCGTADFFHNTNSDSYSTQSNNISSDGTADGPNSQRNVDPATIFRDYIGNDYGLILNSPALDAGKNVSEFVSTDWNGRRRIAPPDLGIFEGLVSVPLMAKRVVRNDLAELATLWQVVRRDGVGLFFTDANEPIVFQGQTYRPLNGPNASTRLGATGLNEGNVSFEGQLDDEAITESDLISGRYDRARVTEFVVDWRYPWARPAQTEVRVIDNVRQTGEVWSGDFVGVSNLLERRSGRIITRTCPYVLGDDECRADIRADTLSDVRVDSVIDEHLAFLADATDIPASYADDFFGGGELFWLTGDNEGLFVRVKSYVQATRELRLDLESPMAIQVGDTFRIKPGCRKRYIPDCITKFNNGRNYGGDPYTPIASDQLETPRR